MYPQHDLNLNMPQVLESNFSLDIVNPIVPSESNFSLDIVNPILPSESNFSLDIVNPIVPSDMEN